MMQKREKDRPLQSDRSSLAVCIAKIYVFCLTIRMIAPLKLLESIIGSAALSFDIIPHFFGVLILIIQKRGEISFCDEEGRSIWYFIKMVIWFIFSSLIMAIIIQLSYGNMGNENAFQGIKGMALYWLQYALILLYNYYVFRILTMSELECIIQAEIIFLLIIGYFQMAVMLFGSQIGNVYDKIDFLDVLCDSVGLSKLSLTGYEGAYTGYITGILVLPYIYARSISNKSKGVFLKVLIWLPLIYMSFSTNTYILFVLITVGYLYYYIKTRRISKCFIIVIGLAIMIAFAILLFGNEIINLLPADFAENIQYILFEKIQDNNNGSTVLRSLPFYYNLGAFSEFPIIGVGNGLQGYFLEKYLPASFSAVKGIDSFSLLKEWTSGIANGSLFWLGILSGYGIVGIILIIIYIIKSERILRAKKKALGAMYYMYRLAIIGIIFAGFATEFVAKYYVWFAISIPLIPVLEVEKEDSTINNRELLEYKYLR